MKRVVVFIFVLVSLITLSQSLDEFQLPGQSVEQPQPYWLHQTLLKTTLVVIFSIAGLIVFRRSKFSYPVMAAALVVNGFVMGGFLCPITAVQNVLFKATTGYLILFLVPVIFSFLFGRIHCGYVCPYGMVQEFLGMKSFLKIPEGLDRVLRKFKYVFLSVLVAFALYKGDLVLRNTPFRELFNFEITPSLIFWVVLSIVVYRPFCRYLCPYGALLGLVSKLSIFGLRIDEEKCVKCTLCERKCRVNAIRDGIVGSECIMCGSCVRCCSTKAINFKEVKV